MSTQEVVTTKATGPHVEEATHPQTQGPGSGLPGQFTSLVAARQGEKRKTCSGNEATDVPIADVAKGLGLTVRRAGSANFIPCPNCEDRSEKRPHHCQIGGGGLNLAHCHRCDWSGDVVGLVKAARSCAARDAFGWLRDTFHLPGPAYRGPPPDPLTQLAQVRGWSIEALKALGCTAEDGRVVFPMWNVKGERIGDKLRRGDNQPFQVRGREEKSLTRKGTHHGLFCPQPFPTSNPVLICEGEADTAAALSAGWSAVVGTAGSSPGEIGRQALQKLLRGRECILAPDGDEAGRKWLQEVGSLLANVQCRVFYIPADTKGDLDDRLRHEQDKAKALQALIEEAHAWQDEEADEDDTVAGRLMRIAGEAELFHAPGGRAFARVKVDGRYHILPVEEKGGGLRRWVVRRYAALVGTPPYGAAVTAVMEVLKAQAEYGPQHPVFVRLAEHEGNIYLDLADGTGRAIKISPDGYEVVVEVPVRFWCPRKMQSLPAPEGDASELGRLAELLNIPEPKDLLLLVGWLLGTLQPGQSYPILGLFGEPGSTKSTTTKAVRMLVDPAGESGCAISRPPREERDVAALVRQRHILAFDNLSKLPTWLSDCLSAIATGVEVGGRALFTDSDLTGVEGKRPIVFNGVAVEGAGSDFLDRCVILILPQLRAKRKTESDFWKELREAWPFILGGLCDAASTALRKLPDVEIPEGREPRMLDFTYWILAAEEALKKVEAFAGLDFLEVYTENQAETGEQVLEASLIAPLILRLAREAKDSCWEGTSTALLGRLGQMATEETHKLRGWPRNPQVLSGKLTRLTPALRRAGVVVERNKVEGRRVIRLSLSDGEERSLFSQASQEPEGRARDVPETCPEQEMPF